MAEGHNLRKAADSCQDPQESGPSRGQECARLFRFRPFWPFAMDYAHAGSHCLFAEAHDRRFAGVHASVRILGCATY